MSDGAARPRRVWGKQTSADGRTPVMRRAFARAMGLAAAAFLALSVHSGVAQAAGARSWQVEGDEVRHVVVTVNKSRTFKIDQPFATAVVSAPEIADVLPMTDNSIYIQGKKIGTTNVSVFDAKHLLIGVLDLEIAPDVGNIRDKIQSSTGSGNIHVSSANGQVVLSGEAADAVAADRALSLARGLASANKDGGGDAGKASGGDSVVNAMNVASSQQVMLKVRFLEASRSAGNALGVNWYSGNRGGTAGATTGNDSVLGLSGNATPGGSPIFSALGTLAGTASTSQPFGVFLAHMVNGGNNIDALVTALETKGLVRRLAEPDLVALSGDKASFLAGGEFPVPVPQTTSGSAPTITVDYKKYGVQLTFTPTVLANGVINLRLQPEVSDIDTAHAVQISGFSIPAVIVRTADTTVELRDGQSFAIAGLLQATNASAINQLPWLGSVPVLGALFRSESYQKNETDLVIIVTPHLVRPAEPGARLATPFDNAEPGNDVDIFAMGQLERKKKYTEYVSSGGELKGPYGHIIKLDESPDPHPVKK